MPDERRRGGDRLDTALPALARLAAQHHTVPDEAVASLLAAQGGDADPATFDRARRFVAALAALRRGVEAARQLAVEALTMSGLPEAAVLEAVEAVAGSSAPGQSQPLNATVERLDLGTLAIGAGAQVSFELTGGPGRIVADHPQLVVEPLQFGPGVTRISVQATPLTGAGVVLTALRAVTPAELLEIPVFARWAATASAPSTAANSTASKTTPAPSASASASASA